ncbi:enoyl-CoA hydratase/isomerase family protein [Streptomyces sp. HNM0575]|uniref:enoyl-CoA hydratase/isomerase family protein n=1 Tax=Streptomyces sp. HNM0575 TaxID=2716338 RepID=UPI00145D0CBF|nr:enoyl-CoA hydratase/isomerase family protein [Streptomyces sp. HNM0575]NLU73339.1 enoyl-CoA hydratase/isomerase family protein [Streptomyces sp. HNM0575]
MTGRQAAVLVRTEGRAAYLTLNRPEALNALTHGMVRSLTEALARCEADPGIETIVLTGAGERGLCAGGDIRSIYDDLRSGQDASATAQFWKDEYRLNARIARCTKPYVAVMDGLVMGGGVGVSAHGSVRVVTERSRIAMPETGIGFVPDVGGCHLLAHAPGESGTHLALTGTPVGAADALLCGLADHFVPVGKLADFVADLSSAPVQEVLHRYTGREPDGLLADRREWIDRCYAAGSAEEIVERLTDSGRPEAKEAAELLLTKSPTAVKVALAAVRRARDLGSLERVLEQDYRISLRALASADLMEGIRAQVIDKDRSPNWSPPTLQDVRDETVARFFAPLGAHELSFAADHSTREATS